MSLTTREASESEIREILGWTHALWGGGRPFEAYLEKTKGLLETPWGRENYRFILGLDQGVPVTACKRYLLAWHSQGHPVPAVGFGAVFTPETHRGKGYAAALVQSVMASEARRGTRLALLYSDIGSAYYESLGFRLYELLKGTAASSPGPVPFRLMRPDEQASALEASFPASELRPCRSASHWDFLRAKSDFELLAFAPEGAVQGFAAIELGDDLLWIEAAGYAEASQAPAFWSGLRALAASRGVARVAGWLPRETVRDGYALEPLTKPLPMVASLAGDRLPQSASWWGLDHF